MPRGKAKQYEHIEAEWIHLYVKEGLTFMEIAERFHVQPETVSKYIKNRVSKRTNRLVKTWLKAYQNGRTFAEIARKYNVSETKVKTNVYKELAPILEELKPTWVALYKKGKTFNCIGETYHFHPKVVFNIIKDEVNLVYKDERMVYEPFINDWIKEYNDGFSFNDLAEKYQVSTDTVYRNIKAKVKVRNKKTNKETIKKLVPLWRTLYYDHNYTLKEISDKYNIACSTVHKYIKNHVINN